MATIKTLPLNPQLHIPILGFGTWQLKGSLAQKAVETALSTGYRLIDTADFYDNHRAIAQAVKASRLPRSDLFITSKIWRSDLAYQDVLDTTKHILAELETDYLDLLLIHWPNPAIPISETLSAFTKLQADKLIKAIGVSNFDISLLEAALATQTTITNNQIEYHPSLNQQTLKDFCEQKKVVVTAYSPLAQGADLELPLIQSLSQKYSRSPSQIILNWLMSKDMVVIPKAATPEHILDNFRSLEWQLDPEDILAIDQLSPS